MWAKLVVLCVLVGSTALATMFVSFWISQAMLSEEGLSVGLGAPYVLHVILSAPVYLMLVAAMGLALGMLVRHTAGAISSLVGVLFLLPIVFALLPGAWARETSPYLFGAAGQAFWSAPSGGIQITNSAAAFLVVAAWVWRGIRYRLLPPAPRRRLNPDPGATGQSNPEYHARVMAWDIPVSPMGCGRVNRTGS